MGMTDAQFKMHLRMLLRLLAEAKEQDSKDEIIKKIEILMNDLQVALED